MKFSYPVLSLSWKDFFQFSQGTTSFLCDSHLHLFFFPFCHTFTIQSFVFSFISFNYSFFFFSSFFLSFFLSCILFSFFFFLICFFLTSIYLSIYLYILSGFICDQKYSFLCVRRYIWIPMRTCLYTKRYIYTFVFINISALSYLPYRLYSLSHNFFLFFFGLFTHICLHRGAGNVMVIVVGNGHGDMSSNPRRGYLHFTWDYYPRKRHESNYSPSNYG